ncbi:hypothetical protein CCHL11_05949 [Colletotrichum chlorophyti]|uniref:Uncharacterized protein n=1 Tax=Colletotrichum chlorophyti TaxID=708187 RepID=A0A1Q8RJ47_9PEZI|nr:hypothetical protein CCHL11_05949 [Colletotrichum chlorophyti]
MPFCCNSGSSDNPPDYTEFGRTYDGFRRGRYLFPIDEVAIKDITRQDQSGSLILQAEKDRLDIFHRIIFLARRQRLYEWPLPDSARVLDLGTGTGIWAIDVVDSLFAKGKDDVQVLGLDLALIQPKFIPTCATFTRADIEEPWPAPEQMFDLVHVQMLLGSIRDWTNLYRKSFRHLRPGGYIEQVEIEWVPLCDDNTMPANSPLHLWSNTLRRAMQTCGQPIDVFDVRAELHAAGFTNITENVIKLPLNPWSTDKFEEEIGRWFNLGLTHCLEALTLMPFIRIEGWQKQEVDMLVDDLKREICRLHIHGYCRMWVSGCRLSSWSLQGRLIEYKMLTVERRFVWTGRKPGQ